MKRNRKTEIGKKLALLLLAALTALQAAGTVFAASENATESSAPISGPLAVRIETAEIQTYLSGKSYPSDLLKTIRDAIINGTATDISIYEYDVPTSEISDLLNAVREAYPLEYAAQGVSRYGWSSMGGVIYSLTLYESANFDDGLTAAQRCAKLHQIMDPVVAAVRNKSNYEKIIAIHDNLVLNSQYDTTYERSTAYELLTEGTAVCQGYADAFKLYMSMLDIPCAVISSDDMNHAWNLVKLGGQWYHVDVTWDDPTPNSPGVTRYTHTLLNDDEIAQEDHYGWYAEEDAASTAYSLMPRGTNRTQYWQNGRWYYVSNGTLFTCDQYGKNVQTLVSDIGNSIAVYGDVILYGSGTQIKTYWPDSALTGELYALTAAEKAKSDYPDPDETEILSLSVDSSGRLSYTYRIWVKKSGTNSYSGSSANGAKTIDLSAFFGPVNELCATVSNLPFEITTSDEAASARSALAQYDSLSDAQRTNLPPDVLDKISCYQINIDNFREIHVTDVWLSEQSLTMAVGQSATLTAEVSPSDTTDSTGWSSSDPSVATVTDGQVTAVAPGSAVISFLAGDISAHCSVTVSTPLAITAQPADFTGSSGSTAKFTVKASGDGLSYQWQLSDDQGNTWRNSSVKTASYATTLSANNDGRYVRCIVTDKYGNSVKSNAAAMKMTALAITTQPANQTVKNGATASFKVVATGSGLTYQWQLSDDQGKTWRNSKATTANYSAAVTDSNNGRYVRCIVTDKYGNSVKSNAAIMKITTLAITTQPVNQTVKNGATASFKVVATGSGLTYQWQLSDDQGKTWRNSKATTANYSAAVTDSNNGRYVRCIVTDKFGNSIKSNAAIMKLTTLKITTQPVNAKVAKGATASFKVVATGSGLTYQWQLSDDQGKTWRNSKATTANYSAAVTDSNNGRYVRCIVTDKFGNSVKSNAAIMKIK